MADKRILAIDTSTGPCSVAVWAGHAIVAYIENARPVMQSASLLPMVEEALRQSSLGYRNLDLVACTTGPGSFTGIRVGLAAARGIAFASGIESVGYTTLQVLAHAAKDHENILAILNAGKGEWYYQCYVKGQPCFAPRLAALEVALGECPVPAAAVGNAGVQHSGFSRHEVTFPRADWLARLAASDAGIAQELRPFYIREPDAKLPAAK